MKLLRKEQSRGNICIVKVLKVGSQLSKYSEMLIWHIVLVLLGIFLVTVILILFFKRAVRQYYGSDNQQNKAHHRKSRFSSLYCRGAN